MSNVDFNFLKEVEGFETSGYVPRDKNNKALENSGVTIGSGVDLGQWDEKEFKKIGVPEEIINKVKPYFGKKKQSAINLLTKNPLNLSVEEADVLNTVVKSNIANKVEERFNKDSDIEFGQLPPEVQTAITSVGFQYGNGLYNHNFWKQVTEGKWEDAYSNLMDYKDKYGTRRRKEAALMLQGFTQPEIPSELDSAVPPVQNYTVEAGDTLSSISRKLGIGVSDLVDMNNITDPNMIQPGLTLSY